ncbi:MAG: glycosyltransferase family 4 protein [Simkania sp.]|nr:glycosyltransferase family 4 protein [Simkania sp.]
MTTPQKKLRVGVDVTPLTKAKAGVGNYIFYLLDELVRLKSDVQFYLYAPSQEGDLSHFAQYAHVKMCTVARLSQSHSIWGQTTLAWHLFRDKIDVFWATTQSFPLCKRKAMKVLFTLHDFVYLLYPHTVSRVKCSLQRLLTRTMLQKADYILPNSYGTAARLKQYYGLDHHIVVEPPIKPWLKPIDPDVLQPWLEKKQLSYQDYLVTIGTLEPRKNFESVLSVYDAVLSSHDPALVLPLVIIGGEGWRDSHLKNTLEKMKEKYPHKVLAIGYTAEEEQWYYLAGAHYLLLLSHYEGYGMPIAEARTCGVEVICTDSPEMREAALEQGVFIDKDRAHEDLKQIFLRSNSHFLKQCIEMRYPTNREKAARIASILESIS